VIAVISWMAGMLYLPRLFVYHADAEKGSAQSETFKVMERRLLRAIINPAMIATWVFGLWLAWKGFAFHGGWLHAKIALVLVLSGLHGYLAGAVRKFAEDKNEKPARHWRIVNEIP
ncbi:CopD family protein, partial [bacterium M00.F.Ca.ET.229.01.1.1]